MLRELVFCAVLMLMAQSAGHAQMTKQVGQHTFDLPEDWPVEKRGGLVTPIPTEEYVSMKFQEVEKNLQSLKEDVASKFSEIETSLKGLEEDLGKKVKEREDEGRELTIGLKGVVSDIKGINAELARLSRSIADELKEMQGELEKLDPEIRKINKDLDSLQTQIYRLEEKIDYYRDEKNSSY